MVTVTFCNIITRARSVTAVYTVHKVNEQGATYQRVDVTVDFDELRDLVRKAVDSKDGRASLHFSAIRAKVIK